MAYAERPLTPQQERFVITYVAGPDNLRGNGLRAYEYAFPNSVGTKHAASSASRLLKRANVLARVRILRDEAEAESKARLLSWMEHAPEAQATLLQAMQGEWPEGMSDEEIRQAVKAAQVWLDRALGSVQQMHALTEGGQTINVVVAAGVFPIGEERTTEEPAQVGRMVALP